MINLTFFSLPFQQNTADFQSFYIQKLTGIEAIYSMGTLGRNRNLLGNFVLLLGSTLINEKNVYELVTYAAAEMERFCPGSYK